MPTTTIRIDEALKARLVQVAQRSGKTAHALILEAIAQTVAEAEIEAQYNDLAETRWKKYLADGKSVSWPDARSYIEARARGERPRKPAVRKTLRRG
jgi:predicted transcriptional regulator